MQLDLGRPAARLGLRPGGALYVQPVFVRYTRLVSAAEAVESLKEGRMAFVRADQVEAALSSLRQAGWSVPVWTGEQQHV